MVVMIPPTHLPVLLDEALELLAVRPGGTYVDCTTGLGGHTEAIAERMGAAGRLLCLDQDGEALEFARARVTTSGRRVTFARANFSELAAVAAREGFAEVDGVLMDLGISSMQVDRADRGFSFLKEGPLDMRMDRSRGETAADIVNTWSEGELADLFFRYGEEQKARRIARAIVAQRPFSTTTDLAHAVEQVAGSARGRNPIHPATRCFLALRIQVNGELDSLELGLPQACNLLARGAGRIVVIAFHSLEDRIVKQFFRREASDCICPPRIPECRCGHRASLRLLTPRAVRPGAEEIARNPRARSAVLRAAERLP